MRATPARVMCQRLAMKTHNVGPRKAGQHLGVGGFHHLGGLSNPCLSRPAAKGGTDHRTLGVGVGAIGVRPECFYGVAIGQHHRRINTVERCSRHRPQRPDRPRTSHLSNTPRHRYTALSL